MNKKSQDFSIDQLKNFLQTPNGKQLLQMLQSADSASLQQATQAAKAGDYTKASESIQKLLTPQMQDLLKNMGGK